MFSEGAVMAKLWQSGDARSQELVDRYTAADDAVLDNHIVEMDVYTNAAHVRMLSESGYMKAEEAKSVLSSLADILASWKRGDFTVLPEDEDVHTKIENTITQSIGDAGKRIHTGRSRNDQVLCDMRLFCKLRLYDTAEELFSLAAVLLDFAEEHKDVPMPGYTHMQRGMPSSVGLWAGGFAEALIDDALYLQGVQEYVDASPLGSGAGYGITLGISRERTRELLGFSRIQLNSIYCQNSRGKMEGAVLSVLSGIMLTLGRLASDLLLFTTSEYSFFSVDPSLTTGSSIMPQKKNLDIMELLRARVRTVLAAESLVKGIPGALPSGYSRDLQETKRPLIESFLTVEDSLAVCAMLIRGISPNKEKMTGAMGPELFATDDVFALVEEGMPFREAYGRVKAAIDAVEARDPSFDPDPGKTPGTPQNPALDLIRERLGAVSGSIRTGKKTLKDTLSALLD